MRPGPPPRASAVSGKQFPKLTASRVGFAPPPQGKPTKKRRRPPTEPRRQLRRRTEAGAQPELAATPSEGETEEHEHSAFWLELGTAALPSTAEQEQDTGEDATGDTDLEALFEPEEEHSQTPEPTKQRRAPAPGRRAAEQARSSRKRRQEQRDEAATQRAAAEQEAAAERAAQRRATTMARLEGPRAATEAFGAAGGALATWRAKKLQQLRAQTAPRESGADEA